MCFQVSRRFELSLTVLALVNVNMALLDMDLSFDKVLETLRTKVTSLPIGHFGPILLKVWELLSNEADYPNHGALFGGLKRF